MGRIVDLSVPTHYNTDTSADIHRQTNTSRQTKAHRQRQTQKSHDSVRITIKPPTKHSNPREQRAHSRSSRPCSLGTKTTIIIFWYCSRHFWWLPTTSKFNEIKNHMFNMLCTHSVNYVASWRAHGQAKHPVMAAVVRETIL